MIWLAAATAMTFNLVCSGDTWESYKLLGPAENKRPFEIVYRVDLSTGRYCLGKCTKSFPIKEVSETRIVFEMEERAPLDDTIVFVSREDGSYFDRTRHYVAKDAVLIIMAQGECQMAPFTGLPKRKF